MKKIVDVVNFNADASCLAPAVWLKALEGGIASQICQWLNLYVKENKKVVLGFVGGTAADIASFNPEAIALINANPEVFEIIPRPFSHDIGLLRSDKGFALNISIGLAVTRLLFKNIINYFLPPEFMLTSRQIKILSESPFEGVFLNPARFKADLQERIPDAPYLAKGVLGSVIPCIPFQGWMAKAYVNALHAYSGDLWNQALLAHQADLMFSWRDGESCFLLPEGVEREGVWLQEESSAIERMTLREALGKTSFASKERFSPVTSLAYPVHSFQAWFKEFRMLGFLARVDRIETRLEALSTELLATWLQVINSDILSAVEKQSPVITLKDKDGRSSQFTIWRTERGFEGEDYLAIIESDAGGDYIHRSDEPHLKKLAARISFLKKMNIDGLYA